MSILDRKMKSAMACTLVCSNGYNECYWGIFCNFEKKGKRDYYGPHNLFVNYYDVRSGVHFFTNAHILIKIMSTSSTTNFVAPSTYQVERP